LNRRVRACSSFGKPTFTYTPLSHAIGAHHDNSDLRRSEHLLEPANIFGHLTTIDQFSHDNKTYDSITDFTTNLTSQLPLTIEMKTDNYLTLCLEQATKSPLHYRHGCIVVRGGKVIGQGHNDYRPGFDGGALKHGRVASSALNGPALADMKAKLKQRKAEKLSPKEEEAVFERHGNGGGPQANTPLSMHSEMMAIHSALSTSSTMACSTFSREKPCFKLSASDKKKERLRRDVLRSYVESICASAGTISACGGKVQIQECGFEDSASRRRQHESGQGRRVSRSEGYRETPESVREEEWETSRVRTVRSGWETETARFPGETGSAVCCV
jgi:deoxycytidylate deaminase